ncbi:MULTISPECIES: flavin reductase [unclassified Variovorax]|uniref:flavin reductase n=1 Tax=unclassified Variovorax TaxID=663243 RepID=UPI001BD56101|nr:MULTISPECIES: flavin reductase [unclassified Variovorax]
MTATIDKGQFRKALGSFTTGVTIVTTRGADGKDYGLTANSFNSVSMDPPMVLWSLGKNSSSIAAFKDTDYFAVHILAADQEVVSNRFAKSGTDKFAGAQVARGHGEVPLLDGCSARFECRVAYQYDGGDHIIFVGEVLNFDHFARPPLIFHGGNYGLLLKKADEADVSATFGGDWLGNLLGRAYYQLLMPIKADLKDKGLRDVDYNVLSVLSMGDSRTFDELSQLVAISGYEVKASDIQALVEQGLIKVEGEGPSGLVRFTGEGRAYAIELLAAGKSAEANAERELDYREAQVLKLLLKRVIQSTSSGLPSHWRKEHFWRENNLWRDEVAANQA